MTATQDRPRKTYRYRVYVIELSPEVVPAEDRPRYRGFLYVGQTCHSPEHRFAQHKAGKKSSKFVRKFGRHLRPDLYEHLPELEKRRAAEHLEEATAARLEDEGYFVHWG